MRKSCRIFLITLVLASLIYIVNPTYAANACCEKTLDGQWCAYVDESQCDPAQKQTYASCEQTSYCSAGCCYSSDTGQCFKSTAKAACAQVLGALWSDKKDCSIDQCKLGCCLLGDQAIFTTEVKCKKTASQFEDLPYKFDNAIQTEVLCIATAKSQDEGCCVKSNSCSFSTRGQCDTSADVKTNATKGTGFYKDMLCSNDQLDCDCAKQSTTKCFGEDLRWIDSCGNKENIYNSNKETSYNKGFTLKESESCTISSPGDNACGNCDYAKGTICGKDPAKNMPVGGETCVSLGCAATYKDDAGASVNADGTKKKNGESWCVYDSIPGQGLDLVGSRHYRHMCINGEEQVETCKDFREEICVQGVLDEQGKQQISSTFESFFSKGDYIEAACRPNRFQVCTACNNGDWNADKREKCCTNADKDCYWTDGFCAPQVPPGLKFWGESKKKTEANPTTTSDAPKGSADQKCSQFEPSECKVLYHRSGWGRIFSQDEGHWGWKIEANEKCTTKEWVVSTNDMCKSMGDCGAYFNILGDATTDGYYNTLWDEKEYLHPDVVSKTKLKVEDLGKWHTLLGPPEASPKGPGVFKQFFKDDDGTANWYTIGFLTAGGVSGLIGGIYGTGGFLSAFGTGLAGVPTALSASSGTTGASLVGTYGAASSVSAGSSAAGMTIGQGSVVIEGASTVSGTLGTGAQIAAESGVQVLGANGQLVSEVVVQNGVVAVPQGGSIVVAEGTQGVVAGQGTATAASSGATTLGTALNAAMWIYMVYKIVDIAAAQTEDVTYKVECLPWQAPTGGDNCEKCNEAMKPCSEYKCKSLGQSCELINKGLGNETCVAIDSNDVSSPRIKPLISVLPNDLQTEVQTTDEPSNPGYTITKKLKAFTPVTIGISTDEPSQCKLAPEPKKKFEEMTQYFGSSVYTYNHTTKFTLPSELAKQEVVVKNNGEYAIYVRCRDANGNENERDYFIKFTIDATPDLTPPEIQYTSILNNGYIANNVTTTPFSAYVNEPADCKWSKMDIAYPQMENTMQCARDSFGQSSVFHGTYECKTTLSGIGLQPTNYFIKCKDKPEAQEQERNVNADSFKFTVQGSLPLHMLNLEPSGTQYQNTITMKTTTAVGAERGKATCAFSKDNTAFENMILFAKTNDMFHEQPFEGLATGEYTFHVKCRDIAGNEASNTTTFKIEMDTGLPRITELYVDGVVLHLTFDEKSTCEYSDKPGKAFGEGTMMTNANSTAHEASLNLNSYYIRCKDLFGNEGQYEIHL